MDKVHLGVVGREAFKAQGAKGSPSQGRWSQGFEGPGWWDLPWDVSAAGVGSCLRDKLIEGAVLRFFACMAFHWVRKEV